MHHVGNNSIQPGDFMTGRKKKSEPSDFVEKLREKRLNYLKSYLRWKKEETALKSSFQINSHSLLWVWEFSKKAVLICFVFYVIVQIYTMVIMIIYCDFTYLGDLVNQTGEILKECVFMYLVKAGIENFSKIFCSRQTNNNTDEPDG